MSHVGSVYRGTSRNCMCEHSGVRPANSHERHVRLGVVGLLHALKASLRSDGRISPPRPAASSSPRQRASQSGRPVSGDYLLTAFARPLPLPRAHARARGNQQQLASARTNACQTDRGISACTCWVDCTGCTAQSAICGSTTTATTSRALFQCHSDCTQLSIVSIRPSPAPRKTAYSFPNRSHLHTHGDRALPRSPARPTALPAAPAVTPAAAVP